MLTILFANWRLIGWTLAVLAVLAYGASVVSKHDAGVRAPLQREIKFLEDSIAANKKQAQALLTQREQENADLAEKWRQYSRKSDDDYEAKIAGLRVAGSSGLRLYKGCGDGSSVTGQAQAGNPEAPAKPATESRTGDAAGGVIFGAEEVGQVLQWYAYGQSCHAFVNGK